MGIPKFYRWLSERYPLTNQKLQTTETPEIDNLYLDMNGIIHNCTHDNDGKSICNEDEMIAKIFNYLQKLVQIAQPRKVLFMAIDGVAPRAKMNQQRTRRFRAAKDREEARLKAERTGEALPEHGLFDSNCITPGTPFMARLSEHLKFFTRNQIAHDPQWQKMTTIFSGHDIPGEGEHKIMEFMRLQKLQPGYSPNERHCLYGLDADLIMLSLVTHEPHFALLREVVSYSGGNRGQPARETLDNPSANNFVLLQIGVLREYLALDFQSPGLPFGFDIERIIDDVILFCMLVGNDFLPHSPTLDISEGAMTTMFDTYKRTLPTLGGYLTNAGRLDHGRLQAFLHELSKHELQTLQERAQDTEAFEAKRKRRGRDATFEADVAHMRPDDGLLTQTLNAADPYSGGEEAENLVCPETTMMSKQARDLLLSGNGQAGLNAYKARMYRKMHADTPEKIRSSVEWYLEGLHWVLEYYYRGVPAWDWFYPFHYAPFLSDMTDLESIECHFTLGAPVLPYQQLLSVLPAQSAELLPLAFRWLMCDPASPVHEYYPLDFEVDGEGKRQEYEAVVLVPFIDKARMLAAYASVDQQAQLSAAERSRNAHGRIMVFTFDPDSSETSFCTSTLPAWRPSVHVPKSACVQRERLPALPAGQLGFQPTLLQGCCAGKDALKVGWPSLNVLQMSGQVKKVGMNVFGMASKLESVVVTPQLGADAQESPAAIAASLLGKRCFIWYPYLVEAKVVCVTDGVSEWTSGAAGVATCTLNDAQAGELRGQLNALNDKLLKHQGIDVAASRVYLKVRPCEGFIRTLDGTVEKRFSKEAELVPLQAALRTHPAAQLQERRAEAKVALPPLKAGEAAVFLGRTHYGALATVLPQAAPGTDVGSAQPGEYIIELRPLASNTSLLTAQTHMIATREAAHGGGGGAWMHNGAMARKLGLDPSVVGRLTSSVFLTVGENKRVDVGLALRGQNNLCVPDYARPAQHSEFGWELSEKVLPLLKDYKARFSWVINLLGDGDERAPAVRSAFPALDEDGCMARVKEIQAWRSKTPFADRKLVPSSSKVLPAESIQNLLLVIDAGTRRAPGAAIMLENVAAPLLLPSMKEGSLATDLAGGAMRLGDRVVGLSADGGGASGGPRPPFGS